MFAIPRRLPHFTGDAQNSMMIVLLQVLQALQ